MGKIHCHVCGKKCKGEVLKLSDRYFHSDCFKCKQCAKPLSEGGFFCKDNDYFCPDDYQKKFGVKCFSCEEFVEGEVVTCLGNTFHHKCFKCSHCKKPLEAGDKCSFNGKAYYCKPCADQISPDPHGSPESPTPRKSRESRKPKAEPKTPPAEQTTNGPLTPDISFTQENGDGDHVNENQYDRTPSPSSSVGSHSSGSLRRLRQAGKYEPHFDADYGHMYPKSYLKTDIEDEQLLEEQRKKDKYKRSNSPSSMPPKSPHFHRPNTSNFSYSRAKTSYIVPGKKGYVDKGMMILAKEHPRSKSPTPLDNAEPIRLSHYPDGVQPRPDEKRRIERDDWPGPPCAAAILPEIMRSRRKSENEEEPEIPDIPEDPKVLREINEISKFKNSGMSQMLLKDYEEKRKKRSVSPSLDPWRASRAPSADHEPDYKTRYESPIFASPSRDRDRPKISFEETALYSKSATLPNYPDDEFYGNGDSFSPHASSGSGVRYQMPVAKPGYTYGLASKSASLPGAARAGVDLGRYEGGTNHVTGNVRSSTSVDNDMISNRSSTLIRAGGRYQGSHYSEVLNHTPLSTFFMRRSMPSLKQEAYKTYPYEELKVSKPLPKDVDKNCLEKYLDKEEFENIFHMNRDQFYKMTEWRRNDLKRRAELY